MFFSTFEDRPPMDPQENSIIRVLQAIDTIKAGGMVIMVDDEDRENEGDLVFAAEHATAEKVNFMAREARGLICLPMSCEMISNLKLPLMDDVGKGPGDHTTAFTVSIEARHGVTTGISAADRAHTIRVAVEENAKPDDLVVPGHIFPLRARPGGVLERSGHTEGSVDLARLAGCRPAAVICEIMNDDGTMARMGDLEIFSKSHGIPIVTIDDLIAYRLTRDGLVKVIQRGEMATKHGVFQSVLFESVIDRSRHLALLKNPENFGSLITDVRVHRQRPVVDVFGSADEPDHIAYGLKMLNQSPCGLFIYLSAIGEGQSLWDFKVQNKDAEQKSKPQSPMGERQLGLGAQIIRALGVHRMRTHVTAQRNLIGLAGYGLEVVEHVIIEN
jgi:3,4-dihydroxy 2-butanone 4-phosphate synthase / GTP cyclohydrolase II